PAAQQGGRHRRRAATGQYAEHGTGELWKVAAEFQADVARRHGDLHVACRLQGLTGGTTHRSGWGGELDDTLLDGTCAEEPEPQAILAVCPEDARGTEKADDDALRPTANPRGCRAHDPGAAKHPTGA